MSEEERTRRDQMREDVRDFHRSNPLVWELFKKFTFEAINSGRKHYSVNAVFERIRWETNVVNYNADNEFKINNNHHAFYARAFMKKYPQYTGFFRIRDQVSKYQKATNRPPLGPKDYPSTSVEEEQQHEFA